MPRTLLLLAAMTILVLWLLAGCTRVGKGGAAHQRQEPGGACEKIAFNLDWEIWTMNSDGSNPQQLTENHGEWTDAGPVWSPDCQKIAFTRTVEFQGERALNSRSHVFVMNADGSDQTKLLDSQASAPDWSPDGKMIVYTADNEIHVMNADGSNPQTLTLGYADYPAWSPAWSPDGERIAYTGQRQGEDGLANFDVYVIKPAHAIKPTHAQLVTNEVTTERRRLTEDPRSDMGPSWSPNGKEIAFTHADSASYPYNGKADVYKMEAGGAGEIRLTDHPDPEYSPDFSPDGGQIVYVRDGYSGAPPGSSAIYKMKPDGSDPTLVRKFPGGEASLPDWR